MTEIREWMQSRPSAMKRARVAHMVDWATEAYGNNMRELREHQNKAPLRDLLYRYITETGKTEEFLEWLAKDMALDKPMDLSRVDAMIDEMSKSLSAGEAMGLPPDR